MPETITAKRGRCHPATKWITAIMPAANANRFIVLLPIAPSVHYRPLSGSNVPPNHTLAWHAHSLLLHRICRLLALRDRVRRRTMLVANGATADIGFAA